MNFFDPREPCQHLESWPLARIRVAWHLPALAARPWRSRQTVESPGLRAGPGWVLGRQHALSRCSSGR